MTQHTKLEKKQFVDRSIGRKMMADYFDNQWICAMLNPEHQTLSRAPPVRGFVVLLLCECKLIIFGIWTVHQNKQAIQRPALRHFLSEIFQTKQFIHLLKQVQKSLEI